MTLVSRVERIEVQDDGVSDPLPCELRTVVTDDDPKTKRVFGARGDTLRGFVSRDAFAAFLANVKAEDVGNFPEGDVALPVEKGAKG